MILCNFRSDLIFWPSLTLVQRSMLTHKNMCPSFQQDVSYVILETIGATVLIWFIYAAAWITYCLQRLFNKSWNSHGKRHNDNLYAIYTVWPEEKQPLIHCNSVQYNTTTKHDLKTYHRIDHTTKTQNNKSLYKNILDLSCNSLYVKSSDQFSWHTVLACISPPVYLQNATQSYPQDRLWHPVCLTFAMVAITAAPAWRPMPLSVLMQESALTGGMTPMGSVVRYIFSIVGLQ